ncbi:DUF1516 family protein [Jeotgalicoccus meleagridis]|uniref:Uncharacterized protein n=1 Tax=Jeotgalicoccus meleagridis TaxID=2759181 RepID=A0A6V7RNK3_9STAP|nr:DUF1516 family protein [Jeotgalicoccus meleagridis]CAD2079955.1 hypothetical protein JEODO184_01801 [Jeotgalicoccus meleagridis]HIW37888.1 DUF1516 family protein [Candidatus Jeotgalicoccus stercoravium]
MIHLHITAIVVSIILFLVVYFMYRGNNSADNKVAKILHMVLRLFYLIVLFSGLMIYVGNMEGISNSGSHMQYGIKVLLGLLSVVFMEVSIVRLKKQSTSATMLMILTLVLIIATIVMGSVLPLGIL